MPRSKSALIVLALIVPTCHADAAVPAATPDAVMQDDLLVAWLSDEAVSPRLNEWPAANAPADTGGSRSKAAKLDKELKKNCYPSGVPEKWGAQSLSYGNFQLHRDPCNLNLSAYTGGERCSQIGSMRGGFLRRGILQGDEAGVWSQPFKMLDGVLIEVVEGDELWQVNDAHVFVNRVVDTQYEHRRGDLQVIRQDFIPLRDAAVFYRVLLRNNGQAARALTLRFTFQANIRPMWHKPWSLRFGPDTIEADGLGRFTVRDSQIPGLILACGALQTPNRAQADRRNPYRSRGVFDFDVNLAPGEEQHFDFLAALLDDRKAPYLDGGPPASVTEYFERLATDRDRLYREKDHYYQQHLLGGVGLECPEPALEAAFHSAKLSLALLSADTRGYLHARHMMACPERGYQLLFGIDTLYPATGATLAGAGEIVRDTFSNHLHYARDLDGASIHFSVSHWGVPQGPARAQETPQLIGAIWEHAQITGDAEWLGGTYPSLVALHAGSQARDASGDGWPDGMTFPGLSEESGADAMLDAAVRMVWATRSMAAAAGALGKSADAERYARLAEEQMGRFAEDWWSEKSANWAIGLRNTHAGAVRVLWPDHRARSLHYPQLYRVADADRARESLRSILSEAVDDRGGYHAPQVTPWQNELLALACYRYGFQAEGIRLLRHAALNPTEREKMLGVFATMNGEPTPRSANSNRFLYSWGSGPYVEAVVAGLFGLELDALGGHVRFEPRLPIEWRRAALVNVPFGDRKLNIRYEAPDWKIRLIGKGANAKLEYASGLSSGHSVTAHALVSDIETIVSTPASHTVAH